eukprot:s1989_g14.t1
MLLRFASFSMVCAVRNSNFFWHPRQDKMTVSTALRRMEEDFKQEQNTTYAVTADMARQYKALQEELIYKINSLEIQHTEQREELDITNHELKELTLVKDADIENKDQQIKQLNERMNDMSAEFANMLAETLDLMKLHINEKLSDAALVRYVTQMLPDQTSLSAYRISATRPTMLWRLALRATMARLCLQVMDELQALHCA